jgi:DNA-binding MarR family transcriptional regulator
MPLEEREISRDIATAFIHLEALDRRALATAEPPLTTAQYHALVALSSVPAQSLNGLAERLICDKANASKLLDRLTALGLATRTRDDEDGRRVILRLTPAGREALANATLVRSDALQRAFSVIQSEDLRAMRIQLGTLVALLRRATVADDCAPGTRSSS